MNCMTQSFLLSSTMLPVNKQSAQWAFSLPRSPPVELRCALARSCSRDRAPPGSRERGRTGGGTLGRSGVQVPGQVVRRARQRVKVRVLPAAHVRAKAGAVVAKPAATQVPSAAAGAGVPARNPIRARALRPRLRCRRPLLAPRAAAPATAASHGVRPARASGRVAGLGRSPPRPEGASYVRSPKNSSRISCCCRPRLWGTAAGLLPV